MSDRMMHYPNYWNNRDVLPKMEPHQECLDCFDVGCIPVKLVDGEWVPTEEWSQ